MPTLHMDLGNEAYDITLERGALRDAGKLFDLDRRVLILTDSGVPEEYSEKIASLCREASILRLPMGEIHKGVDHYVKILEAIVDFKLDRRDCVAAVGGGVVGDMGGFAAATYMRGIDFYNIPTTLLSQVDSSVGGKTAMDFKGYKNLVGAFWQPKGVLIDPEVLKSLDTRQFASGMAEIIKMFATSDEDGFCELEKGDTRVDKALLDKSILKALEMKKSVVEKDVHESGLRKILNFGHTVGHGIESVSGLLHGECVGLGMLCVTKGEVRERIGSLLTRYGLSQTYSLEEEKLKEAMEHDKKTDGQSVTAVRVDKIGSFRLEQTTVEQLVNESREVLKLI